MTTWKKFTGSEEQINEILNAKDGFKCLTNHGTEYYFVKRYFDDSLNECDIRNLLSDGSTKEYLICQPRPHAAMIIEWARTGREVYWFNPFKSEWELKLSPHWFGTDKYSFNVPDNENRSPEGDGK